MTTLDYSKTSFLQWRLLLIIVSIAIFVSHNVGYAQEDNQTTKITPILDAPLRPYPDDPTSDIAWNSGYSGVTDIQTAFNHARTIENSQLGTNTLLLTLPSQSAWDSMDDGEQALWLINRERIDRGLLPLHSVETNVTSVAQYYANYLLDNDTWGHNADGNSPWERLDTNPAINACHDFLSVSENLAVFVTSGNNIPLPVVRAVYNWMYVDSGSSWGHRHAILWYPYNDNSGEIGNEGFLGIGRANGGPYQGPFPSSWNFAEMIVMNVFDPCSSWDYGSDPAPTVSAITPNYASNTGTVHITNLAGHNFSTAGGVTVELRKSGHAPIVATNVSVISESQISCDFDLNGVIAGSWDVVVTNPDAQSGTLADGFMVIGILDEFIYLPLVVKSSTPPPFQHRVVIFEAFMQKDLR